MRPILLTVFHMPIPIIDLFAGPGGLGEGFASVLEHTGQRSFKIGLSVEMDASAHRTLELRAFFREFPLGQAPASYYDYLVGKITRERLFQLHPEEAACAKSEAWCAELGGKTTPEEILDKRIRGVLGTNHQWVLIGGPPCQAYSLAGRSRVIGGKGLAAYEGDKRHHLYKHYLRIIAEHEPAVFVMENVKGLLSAKVRQERIFDRILQDLRNPRVAIFSTKVGRKDEYRLMPFVATEGKLLGELHAPEDFVIRSEQFGIPQARHRLIILGVRSDITTQPDILEPQARTTVEDAIGDLPRLRSGLSKEDDSGDAWLRSIEQITEATWFRNGTLSDNIRSEIRAAVGKLSSKLKRGDTFLAGATKPKCHASWYFDPKLKGVCNHETRGHIRGDLHRYLFASVFANVNGRSPQLEDFPRQLLPDHRNVQDALKETKFNDRFRVQLRDRPSTTVVSHISKDGHYYIHYDPTQCRSLTVREAARLQTFPDNYFFEGNRTEQYKQVGNAVPPLLARQIAEIVAGILR